MGIYFKSGEELNRSRYGYGVRPVQNQDQTDTPEAAFFVLFNLHAVITLAIVFAVLFVMQFSVLPETFTEDSPYFDLLLAMIIVVVGSVAEIMGIRGRIFFIPIWLLGLGCLSYVLYEMMGWQGIIIAVAILGAGIWWLVKLGEKTERREWDQAPEALFKARELFRKGDQQSAEFWSHVEKALFVPSSGNYDKAMCRHNIEVSGLLMRIVPVNNEMYQQVLDLKQEWLSGLRKTGADLQNISDQKAQNIKKFIAQRL